MPKALHEAGQGAVHVFDGNEATKLWIITDGVVNPDTGERYATTLLLPEEY